VMEIFAIVSKYFYNIIRSLLDSKLYFLKESSKGKCYVFAGKVFCHVVKDLLGHFVYNVFLSFLYLIFNIF